MIAVEQSNEMCPTPSTEFSRQPSNPDTRVKKGTTRFNSQVGEATNRGGVKIDDAAELAILLRGILAVHLTDIR